MNNCNKSLDNLLKTDGAEKEKNSRSLENSKKYKNTKRQMRGFCTALTKNYNEYKPEVTVKNIDTYLKRSDKLDRILYSEISNYIFDLSSNQRPTFYANIESLLMYVLDDNNKVGDDSKKVIIKIYDHVQLNIYQIENARNIINDNVVEVKNRLHDEIKGIEREYITILGIFAAIVLAFVGSITFTTSVLQNIDKVSIFRLIMIVDLIAIVLVNTIHLLISFILKINNKNRDDKISFIIILNVILLGILALIILSWFFKIEDYRDYFSKNYNWRK